MSGTTSLVAADLLVLLHLAFVLFVAFGGLLVRWRRAVAWVHLPCAVWGAAVEVWGWTCPLTPLEQRLRQAAGQAGYRGGFVEHYLEPVLYPVGWGGFHLWLAVAVVAGNVLLYVWALRCRLGT